MLFAIACAIIPTVAPFAGAWIEIVIRTRMPNWYPVAPFAGAWIEIIEFANSKYQEFVAPFAGAWIEISGQGRLHPHDPSLPSRERGLKCDIVVIHGHDHSRSLRGSVD